MGDLNMFNNENLEVNIIIPCYNGEKYVDSCMDCIYKQTYDKINIYFVDDGSTDNTIEKINSWKEKFNSRGYNLIIISKKNGGAASAVNYAFSYLKDGLFQLFDVDDYIYPKNIELKVNYLKNNPNVAFVRNNGELYNVKKKKVVSNFTDNNDEKHLKNIFDDLMFGRTFNWPGSYLIRMEAYLECNPQKYIFESRYGQNMQVLLPIAYKYECGFVDEILTRYYEYEKSTSHVNNYADEIRLWNGYKEIRINVIKEIMEFDKFETYNQLISDLYNRKKMQISYNYKNNAELQRYYKQINVKSQSDKILYIRSKCKVIDNLYKMIAKYKSK